MPLVNGLYEQIINKDLDKKLAETDQISDIASIDAAEASKLEYSGAAEPPVRTLRATSPDVRSHL